MLAVLTVRDLHVVEKIYVSKEEISPFGRNDKLIRDSLKTSRNKKVLLNTGISFDTEAKTEKIKNWE